MPLDRAPERRRLELPPFNFTSPIPPSLVDRRGPETKRAKWERIIITDSEAWGPENIASARAEVESVVTHENVDLMRTWHPSLRYAADAFIVTEASGKRIWSLVECAREPSHTHAGGLEIHTVTTAWIHNSFNNPLPGRGSIGWPINTRRLLSGDDVAQIAAAYPRAVGVQVLIAGQVNVLYADFSAMEMDWAQGAAQEVGDLWVGFSVLDFAPSQPDPYGCNVAPKTEAKLASGCLGLALELSSGERVLTTVTHGFVDLPGTNLFSRAAAFVRNITKSLWRFGSTSTDTTTGNSIIGKEVWLADTNTRIGSIKYTFDTPSKHLHYPEGYRHDLSLVAPPEGQPCPVLGPQVHMPTIDGWANLGDVLDGGELFLSAQLLHRSPAPNVQKTVSGTAVSDATRDAIASEQQRAIAEGVQYLFDRKKLDVSVSLLWRMATAKNGKDTPASVMGFSGAVLCLGKPTAPTAKAVVFQNFELPVLATEFHRRGRISASANVKGGFLLPQEILDATILHDTKSREGGPMPANFPARRGEVPEPGPRRSLSGQ